jgi:site-specific recombinase XerD
MTDEEIHARVEAPDTSQWIGRRDHTLLIVAIKIGLRVSELTALCCQDVHVGPGNLRWLGKGRKTMLHAAHWLDGRRAARLAHRTGRLFLEAL